MFEQAFVEDFVRSRRPWTVAISAAGQAVAIAVLVVLTVAHTEALPKGFTRLAPLLPPGGETKKSATKLVPAPVRPGAIVVRKGVLLFPTPRMKPGSIVLVDDLSDAPVIPGTEQLSGPGAPGCIGCIGTGPAPMEQPPPPPRPQTVKKAAPALAAPIPVGGRVQHAKLINPVVPVYPPLARQARVEGTVHLEAIIGRDGAIRNLRLISGHPLLAGAALEAVRQWRYQPTLLNGEPVEVITRIEVHFTLTR